MEEETKTEFHSLKGAKKGDLGKSLAGNSGNIVVLSNLEITESGQVVNTSNADTDASSGDEKK